ncbi:MAG TPA: BRCT domain-containing protein [Gammaproteobacteria bacterium]|nr:BRCT domain-containing protein [Gammaproteobacteria bacterium]
MDAAEYKLLKKFFSEFTALMDGRTITSPRISEGCNVIGLCAVCPEIEFEGSSFCLTGTSFKYTRSEFSKIIQKLGGRIISSVSEKLNYLIIGADGNPCWSYACYGRKVEKAVNLRKAGARILLVHENDFHDAVADLQMVRARG